MTKFIDRVLKLLKEKGIDQENIKYMEMPDDRANYDLSFTIGNVNLSEGRYRTRKEAEEIIDRFLRKTLP